MIERIGGYCKQFRLQVLQLSLTEFANDTNTNLKNIHAFEKGRANNIRYLYLYYDVSTEEQKEDFMYGLFAII